MRSLSHKTLKASTFSFFPINRAPITPLLTSHLSPKPVRSMSSGRIFQLKLDPLTGNSEWVVIEEDEAPDVPPQPPFLATTSYLDMLNDSLRNKAFREAIDKTVTKPCHVLDIGAGTGLLSMMAARAMDSGKSTTCSGSEGMVTACDSYLPMVKLMRKVLHLNGMERKVRVINKRSDELEVGVDVTSRADVLVNEILDSELLGEGLIPTLQNAHDKLLVENHRQHLTEQLLMASWLKANICGRCMIYTIMKQKRRMKFILFQQKSRQFYVSNRNRSPCIVMQ